MILIGLIGLVIRSDGWDGNNRNVEMGNTRRSKGSKIGGGWKRPERWQRCLKTPLEIRCACETTSDCEEGLVCRATSEYVGKKCDQEVGANCAWNYANCQTDEDCCKGTCYHVYSMAWCQSPEESAETARIEKELQEARKDYKKLLAEREARHRNRGV